MQDVYHKGIPMLHAILVQLLEDYAQANKTTEEQRQDSADA